MSDKLFVCEMYIPPIAAVFNPIVLLKNELHYIFKTYHAEIKALFEAYKNIIKTLYEKASEKEIEELFIRHTLMQMIVSSCLTASLEKSTDAKKACSGVEIEAEVILPYLNWWEPLISRGLLSQSDGRFLESLTESVYSRAMLLDWKSEAKEDIFRELYEILIDAETRRKIGEYYTPLWLVEYMVNKASNDVGGFKGKIILDPFCGSGTFLVASFYKKVEEGEDPDSAIKEVVGFDINPLAVSIARAELMIAYQSLKKQAITPLVFNTDSAILLFHVLKEGKPISFIDELQTIERRIRYVDSPLFKSNEIDFSEVLEIEVILRECFREASRAENVKQELKKRLSELREHAWKGLLTSQIVETLTDEGSINAIAKLIEKYGNGVWAVSITSLFAPYIIREVKVDVILTNPPWAQLTEPKGYYGELLRNEAVSLLKDYKKIGQILAGSDIASVLLYGCLGIVRSEVAFLMPEEVVYTVGSFYGLGKLLTYTVVKNYDSELIQIGFDAFQHGRLPSIVFSRKTPGKNICFTMRFEWNGEYSKTLRLSDVKFSVKSVEDYQDYIQRVLKYIEAIPEAIAEELDVQEVYSQGDYIMGLFGGIRKKGAKRYAGLTFDVISEDKIAKQFIIRLSQMDTSIRISNFFLEPYWKRLIYTGEIYPFHLNRVHNILISSEGKENLKEFLTRRVLENISEEEREKIQVLIEELKQPDKPHILEANQYYVIYRRIRDFVSVVLTPDDIQKISNNMKYGIIVYDGCGYIATIDEYKAYYYSSILNYLAYKVTEKRGTFERNQYLRPLIAIVEAGLKWKNDEWQIKVAELGKELHQKAPSCYVNYIKKGMEVAECFKRLRDCDEVKELFRKLIKMIDENLQEKRLNEALQFVCKLKELSY
ncbi:MAG: N-6 DNA methylase [Nitrososphaerota archaeon]